MNLTTEGILYIGATTWLLIGLLVTSLNRQESKKSSPERVFIGWKKMILWPFYIKDR